MASPVASPPPRRPPRSFAGPVVLIVLGIFFLLGNIGILRWSNLGYWFAHYWPVLLILWGVVKLLEYWEAQRHGVRASGVGAGGVVLLIFLIGAGLVATQASRFNWDELRDHIHGNWDDSDFPIFGHEYTFEDQMEEAFAAGSSVHVTSDRGAINASVSDDGRIHVRIHKRVDAENQRDGDKWNAATKPQFSTSGNTLTLSANTEGAGAHRVTTDLDVSLPRKASLTISTKHGDVDVMGRDGDVVISSQHGEVSASDINGKLSLSLDGSSARVSQVSSDVSVEGRANDVSLEAVKGSVRLEGEFMETLKLAKIAKPVTFQSSRTDFEFSKLDGDLNLDSGDLEATNITGPIRLTTRSKDVRLTGISGEIRLRDQDGAVELHFTKAGSMQVENRSGDIQIYLPEKAGFEVNAHASNGEIESDFSELKIETTDDEARASGSIGGGGPNLVISNEHGTIEIRKGTSVAEGPEAPAPPEGVPHPKPRHGTPPAASAPEIPQPTEN
jgi:DUF4097 and DUF4098 domain-containing protein YvlB